jgi:hypothetical protein
MITFNLSANCLSKLLLSCSFLILSSLIREGSSCTSASAINKDETRRTRITPLKIIVFHIYHI